MTYYGGSGGGNESDFFPVPKMCIALNKHPINSRWNYSVTKYNEFGIKHKYIYTANTTPKLLGKNTETRSHPIILPFQSKLVSYATWVMIHADYGLSLQGTKEGPDVIWNRG